MYPNSFCGVYLILAPFILELTEEQKHLWLLFAGQLCDPHSEDVFSKYLTK
jgi:hypothetical protein